MGRPPWLSQDSRAAATVPFPSQTLYHHQMRLRNSLSGLLCSALVGLLACGPAQADERASAPAVSPTPEKEPSAPGGASGEDATSSPNYFHLQDEIRETRARLRALPGRTDILKEKSLYTVFDEELLIRDFFQDRRDGVFVDVGCAWPIRANNTYYLERHLGWTGIGIDALNDYASAWKETRPGSPFLNFMVTDKHQGFGTFYRSQNKGLSSAVKKRATADYFGGELEVEEVRVPAATLTEILDAQGMTHIDLLSLDIEGFELPALRGFDFARFQPELIVAEGGRRNVKALLERHGYEEIERYLPFDETNRYYRKRSDTQRAPSKAAEPAKASLSTGAAQD